LVNVNSRAIDAGVRLAFSHTLQAKSRIKPEGNQ